MSKLVSFLASGLLTQLTYLDLSSNKLEGHIPHNVYTRLTNLGELERKKITSYILEVSRVKSNFLLPLLGRVPVTFG